MPVNKPSASGPNSTPAASTSLDFAVRFSPAINSLSKGWASSGIWSLPIFSSSSKPAAVASRISGAKNGLRNPANATSLSTRPEKRFAFGLRLRCRSPGPTRAYRRRWHRGRASQPSCRAELEAEGFAILRDRGQLPAKELGEAVGLDGVRPPLLRVLFHGPSPPANTCWNAARVPAGSCPLNSGRRNGPFLSGRSACPASRAT